MIVFLSLVALTLSQTPTSVTLTNGVVVGERFADHLAFKGIPYAEPPVGSLRWQPPVPKAPWSTPINATSFSPGCLQFCNLPPHVCPTRMSEDCLYANVFAPATSSTKKRPVLVYFAGGGFFQGAGGDILYDGRFLVNTTDVVLVTCNFRLGAMGFLVFREGRQVTITGNYGIMDEILLLEWVQENIGAFGGDANQVTVFGQSAGAMSIGILLTSPPVWKHGRKLFHGAVMQSNPLGLPYKTQDHQAQWGRSFANSLGCSTRQCMEGKDATEIVAAQRATFHLDLSDPLDMALLWTPNIDNHYFLMHPLKAWEAGLAADVPVIIGTTHDEGLIFVKEVVSYIDEIEYFGFLAGLFGLRAYEVELQYPVSSTTNPDKSMLMQRLVTDYVFQCATRRGVRALAASNTSPPWLYRFDRALSINSDVWGAKFAYCDPYVCHGEELPVLFNVPQLLNITMTPAELALAAQMQAYWGNFAKTLDPNLPKLGFNWPMAGVNASVNLVLDVKLSTNNDFNSVHCDFWDTFYFN